MKELLMLFALAAAMVAVQASRGRGECHEVIFELMHKENMTEIIGSCMEENGIVPNLNGPGRRPGGRRGRNRFGRGKRSPHMMRFISRLPQENQTALAECIFEKEDLLTDDGLFDATAFTEDLVAKLEEIEQSTVTEAMLAAIEDGDCVVEESEPNLMLVFDFIKCLKGVCDTSSEEA
ncbi:uncharacterized protein LOC125033326 isoform X2 [Penaeus chinensis]|uniref:uncharacterized protein LOC125033326 isoform X2 n=1 Tax=Penaeus chinensis TaxID=139456 RepID=UPI001FB5C946|nr:uncharacterized protein LOC125033326 isoform X2 [Penaeus chinensis]